MMSRGSRITVGFKLKVWKLAYSARKVVFPSCSSHNLLVERVWRGPLKWPPAFRWKVEAGPKGSRPEAFAPTSIILHHH